jgi:peptidoglycan/LPS O-acetylase OafA/YrhL
MPRETDSRNITNAIKGLAILTVLVAHYCSRFAYDFYSKWFTDYAASAIAIFFVLSGYGLFFSLVKRFDCKESTGRVLIKFAYSRFVRIYPLYWIAMISIPFFYMPAEEYNNQMYHSGFYSFLIWIGFPLIRNNELWFITAILQCYWVAPLFYFALRKLGLLKYAILLGGLLIMSVLVSGFFYFSKYSWLHLPFFEAPLVLVYKNFFLGNILLFGMGMMMGPLALEKAKFFRGYISMAISTLAFLALLYLTRGASLSYKHSEFFLIPFFYISMVIVCLCAVVNNPPVPFGPFIRSLGKHSYTIYLFQYQWLALLGTAGLVVAATPTNAPYDPAMPINASSFSIVVAILSLPVLLAVCIIVEKGVAWPQRKIERYFVKRRLAKSVPALDAE